MLGRAGFQRGCFLFLTTSVLDCDFIVSYLLSYNPGDHSENSLSKQFHHGGVEQVFVINNDIEELDANFMSYTWLVYDQGAAERHQSDLLCPGGQAPGDQSEANEHFYGLPSMPVGSVSFCQN